MERVTCNSCDSLRKLAEGYKKRLEQKDNAIFEKDNIIRQLKCLVRFLEETRKAETKCLLCNGTGTMQTETGYRNCFCAAGVIPADKTD